MSLCPCGAVRVLAASAGTARARRGSCGAARTCVGCVQAAVRPVFAGSSGAINCGACPAGLSGSMGQRVGYTWGASEYGRRAAGVSERVDREPAERGRGTRAFNPSWRAAVDAAARRTRAGLEGRAEPPGRGSVRGAEHVRTVDSAGRALRRGGPTPADIRHPLFI